ncbi:MAG: hypothetical protein JO142_02215 [Burkholderiales bacterium]|nr:hypothetical protein [Burkholderiales bacterium]
MAFSNQEKVDIRRFCGYGMFGGTATPAFGYRFFTQYGTLEYKLNNLAPEEETTLRAIYLTGQNSTTNPGTQVCLYTLEQAVYGATANLDTDRAAVWVHNKDEVRDRQQLFNLMRNELCKFIGIEAGPGLSSGGGIQLVV